MPKHESAVMYRNLVHCFVFLSLGCGGEHPQRAGHRAPSATGTQVVATVNPVLTAPPSPAEPEPEPEGDAPVLPPTILSAGATTCRVGETHELGVVDRPRTQVAVAFRGVNGLAAWVEGEDSLAVRPLDAGAHPVGATVVSALRKAEGLQLLAPTPNGTIALAAGQICDRMGMSCFQAIGLARDGHALGAPFLDPPADQMASVNTYAVGGSSLFAAHVRRSGYDIVRYHVAGDGTVEAERSQNLHLDGGNMGDAPFRAIAATSAGRAFVLAEYEGAGGRVARIYDTETQRFLPPMRGFGQSPEGITVDLMEIEGDAIVAIAERKLFRIGFDGRITLGPERFRGRDDLPVNIRDRVLATVEAQRGQAVLVRRDLARQVVGEPTVIVPTLRNGAAIARVAWVGDHFVAISGEPVDAGIRITSRAIACGRAE